MKNKTIVITGTTSGVGYELSKLLYKNNTLIAIARESEKLKSFADEYKGVFIYKADLSRLEDIKAVAQKLLKDFSSIDILINNAGVQYPETFLDPSFCYENIHNEITTNLTSICSLSYLLLPLLLHEHKAIILNVNSGLALAPKTTSAIYCATKGGLNIFTQALRYQLEKTNISVQQVFLQLVDTKMTQGRGNNKMSPQLVAKKIIYGIDHNILDHDLGKVKFLRILLRVFPSLAKRIMKRY